MEGLAGGGGEEVGFLGGQDRGHRLEPGPFPGQRDELADDGKPVRHLRPEAAGVQLVVELGQADQTAGRSAGELGRAQVDAARVRLRQPRCSSVLACTTVAFTRPGTGAVGSSYGVCTVRKSRKMTGATRQACAPSESAWRWKGKPHRSG
jgi:hypothetical protein